ncbi:uncharacterized protein METZ01_LOCUS101652, partial [marine metagenome]
MLDDLRAQWKSRSRLERRTIIALAIIL